LRQVDGDITCNRKAFKEFSLPTVLAIYFGSAKKFEAIVYVYLRMKSLSNLQISIKPWLEIFITIQ
jgi:hypothetical protein